MNKLAKRYVDQGVVDVSEENNQRYNQLFGASMKFVIGVSVIAFSCVIVYGYRVDRVAPEKAAIAAQYEKTMAEKKAKADKEAADKEAAKKRYNETKMYTQEEIMKSALSPEKFAEWKKLDAEQRQPKVAQILVTQ